MHIQLSVKFEFSFSKAISLVHNLRHWFCNVRENNYGKAVYFITSSVLISILYIKCPKLSNNYLLDNLGYSRELVFLYYCCWGA